MFADYRRLPKRWTVDSSVIAALARPFTDLDCIPFLLGYNARLILSLHVRSPGISALNIVSIIYTIEDMSKVLEKVIYHLASFDAPTGTQRSIQLFSRRVGELTMCLL